MESHRQARTSTSSYGNLISTSVKWGQSNTTLVRGRMKSIAAEEYVLWGGKKGRHDYAGLLLGLVLTLVSTPNPLPETQGCHPAHFSEPQSPCQPSLHRIPVPRAQHQASPTVSSQSLRVATVAILPTAETRPGVGSSLPKVAQRDRGSRRWPILAPCFWLAGIPESQPLISSQQGN